jgi:hypothetical protein
MTELWIKLDLTTLFFEINFLFIYTIIKINMYSNHPNKI